VKKSPAILVTLFVLLILGTGVGNTIAETKPNFKTSELDERLELIQVTDNIYAIVGPLGNRSPANLGNNATF
jgi:hypothetical protein